MSRPRTRTALRAGALASVLALAAGGLLVATQGAANAGSTPVSLDHFLCYKSTYNGPKAPPGVMLANVIQPKLFTPSFGAANTHCNPANKSIPGALFKVRNPLAHLQCYTIRYPWHAETVLLTNQFGKALMKTGVSPTSLCLPAWKDNVGPPNQPVSQPPGLDHLTCYPLTVLATAYGFKTANVKAEDEFSAPVYVPLKLSKANELCVPTLKVLPTGFQYPPQGANDPSLVCFPTSPTPFWKLIYDQNQFGTSVVVPNNHGEEFCTPSTVSVQVP